MTTSLSNAQCFALHAKCALRNRTSSERPACSKSTASDIFVVVSADLYRQKCPIGWKRHIRQPLPVRMWGLCSETSQIAK